MERVQWSMWTVITVVLLVILPQLIASWAVIALYQSPAAVVDVTLAHDKRLAVRLGQQSMCSPIMTCSTLFKTEPGVSVWLFTGPPTWTQQPAAQVLHLVRQQRLLYLKM